MNTENNVTQEANKKTDNPENVNAILETIRGVMTGKNVPEKEEISTPNDQWDDLDKILDLVNKVEEDGSIIKVDPFSKKHELEQTPELDAASTKIKEEATETILAQNNETPLEKPEENKEKIEETMEDLREKILNSSEPKPLEGFDIEIDKSSLATEEDTDSNKTAPDEIFSQNIMDSNQTKQNDLPEINFNEFEEEEHKAAEEVKTAIPKQQMEQRPELEETKNNNDSLLSEQTMKETSETFRKLLNQTSKQKDNDNFLRKGMAIEDLVIEALKPPLAEWLDKHLPSLVKELVEKEIKRLIPEDENKK